MDAPWLLPSAVRFLGKTLRPDSRVFEYGSGGSTLFFAVRAGEVVSIEHDRAWYEKLSLELERRGVRNCRLRLVEPGPAPEPGNPADPDSAVSGRRGWRGRSFEAYAAAADSHADGSFDVILVDGRARPACMKRAASKVKPGGWLLLDDAERSRYRRAAGLFRAPEWEKRVFFGLRRPYFYPSLLAAWRKAPVKGR